MAADIIRVWQQCAWWLVWWWWCCGLISLGQRGSFSRNLDTIDQSIFQPDNHATAPMLYILSQREHKGE